MANSTLQGLLSLFPKAFILSVHILSIHHPIQWPEIDEIQFSLPWSFLRHPSFVSFTFRIPPEMGQPRFGPVCQRATFIFIGLQAFYQGIALRNKQGNFYCTQRISKSSDTKSGTVISAVKVRYISFVEPQSRNTLPMFSQRKNLGSLGPPDMTWLCFWGQTDDTGHFSCKL